MAELSVWQVKVQSVLSKVKANSSLKSTNELLKFLGITDENWKAILNGNKPLTSARVQELLVRFRERSIDLDPGDSETLYLIANMVPPEAIREVPDDTQRLHGALQKYIENAKTLLNQGTYCDPQREFNLACLLKVQKRWPDLDVGPSKESSTWRRQYVSLLSMHKLAPGNNYMLDTGGSTIGEPVAVRELWKTGRQPPCAAVVGTPDSGGDVLLRETGVILAERARKSLRNGEISPLPLYIPDTQVITETDDWIKAALVNLSPELAEDSLYRTVRDAGVVFLVPLERTDEAILQKIDTLIARIGTRFPAQSGKDRVIFQCIPADSRFFADMPRYFVQPLDNNAITRCLDQWSTDSSLASDIDDWSLIRRFALTPMQLKHLCDFRAQNFDQSVDPLRNFETNFLDFVLANWTNPVLTPKERQSIREGMAHLAAWMIDRDCAEGLPLTVAENLVSSETLTIAHNLGFLDMVMRPRDAVDALLVDIEQSYASDEPVLCVRYRDEDLRDLLSTWAIIATEGFEEGIRQMAQYEHWEPALSSYVYSLAVQDNVQRCTKVLGIVSEIDFFLLNRLVKGIKCEIDTEIMVTEIARQYKFFGKHDIWGNRYHDGDYPGKPRPGDLAQVAFYYRYELDLMLLFPAIHLKREIAPYFFCLDTRVSLLKFLVSAGGPYSDLDAIYRATQGSKFDAELTELFVNYITNYARLPVVLGLGNRIAQQEMITSIARYGETRCNQPDETCANTITHIFDGAADADSLTVHSWLHHPNRIIRVAALIACRGRSKDLWVEIAPLLADPDEVVCATAIAISDDIALTPADLIDRLDKNMVLPFKSIFWLLVTHYTVSFDELFGFNRYVAFDVDMMRALLSKVTTLDDLNRVWLIKEQFPVLASVYSHTRARFRLPKTWQPYPVDGGSDSAGSDGRIV